MKKFLKTYRLAITIGLVALLFVGATVYTKGFNMVTTPKKTEPVFYIDGTWTNKKAAFTVTISSKGHTYRGSAMGEEFDQDYQLQSFHDNIVVFTTRGHKIVALFNALDEMTLTREDIGLPITVSRLKY